MKTIKEIYESIILEAMSLEDIWEKYYNKDIWLFPAFQIINKMDPTASSNKKGKYLDWLIKKAYKNNPKIAEDSSKIKEDLELFDKNYRHINKQITQIKDQYELAKLVEEFRKKKDSGKIDLSRSEIKKDAEKIFEDNGWLIIHPKTEEAAKFYGANTRWCTAADEDNMFNSYNRQGPLYILINKKANKKYQFHFQSNQYMDEEDEPIESFVYVKLPEAILNKLVELANINKNVVTFIFKLPDMLKEKYLKIYEKEHNEYYATNSLALHAKNGNLEGVKEALKNGADINGKKGYPLENASKNGHLEVVKYLVEKGVSVNNDDNVSLLWASDNGHFEVVKFLVENGARISVGNHLPLRYAARNGYIDIVKFLVENGSDLHAGNDNALRCAIDYEHLEIVKFLVKNGADINSYTQHILLSTEMKNYIQSIIDKEKQ